MKVNGKIYLSHFLHFEGLNFIFPSLLGAHLSVNYTLKDKNNYLSLNCVKNVNVWKISINEPKKNKHGFLKSNRYIIEDNISCYYYSRMKQYNLSVSYETNSFLYISFIKTSTFI